MRALSFASLVLAISFAALAAQAQSPSVGPSLGTEGTQKPPACADKSKPAPSLPGYSGENKADPTAQNNPCNAADEKTSNQANEMTKHETTQQASRKLQ